MGGNQDKGVQIPEDFVPPVYSYSQFGYFSIRESVDEISKEKNYGILPENVFRMICLHLRPPDLVNSMLTCKLINKILNTPLFWRIYYRHYYKLKIPLEDMDRETNWKKQFFKRYYFLTDHYYSTRRIIPLPANHRLDSICEVEKIVLYMIGDKGVGKRVYSEVIGMKGKNERTGHIEYCDIKTMSMIDTEDMNDKTVKILEDTGIFLCFSITNRESYDNAVNILKHPKLRKLMRKSYCAPIFLGLYINKKDEENATSPVLDAYKPKKRAVGENEVRKVIFSHNRKRRKGGHLIFGYVECMYDEKRKVMENMSISVGLLIESVRMIERVNVIDILLSEESVADHTGRNDVPKEVIVTLVDNFVEEEDVEGKELIKRMVFGGEMRYTGYLEDLEQARNSGEDGEKYVNDLMRDARVVLGLEDISKKDQQ